MAKKTIIGLTAKIEIVGKGKSKILTARVDTGAEICSMDEHLAKGLNLGPIEKMKKIKSAHGIKHRPVVRANVMISGRKFEKVRFTLADRKHLKYAVLVGQNILKHGFLIDPSK